MSPHLSTTDQPSACCNPILLTNSTGSTSNVSSITDPVTVTNLYPQSRVRCNVTSGSDNSIFRIGSNESECSVESFNTEYNARFNSGLVSLRKGDIKTARYHLSKSLRASIAENGPSHENGSYAHEKLGDISVICKDFNSVSLHYDAALDIMRTNEIQNKRFANILLKIARVMLENGEKNEAFDYYTEALPVLQHLEEEDSAENDEREDVTGVLITIGYLLLEAGHHDDAVTYFSNALARKSADTKRDFSSICMIMGLIYEMRTDYDTAMEYLTMSLSMKKTALGEHHPGVANVLRKIGNVHFKKDQYENAIDFYDQSLFVLKCNAVNFEAALAVYDAIADTYRKTGDRSKAIDRYRDLLEATELNIGDRTDEVGTVLYRIACIHVNIGENDEAMPIFKKAERIKKENKTDTMQVATISMQIGSLYLAKRATERALLYYEDAIHNLSLVLKNDGREANLNDGNLMDKLILCEEALRTERNASAAIPAPSFDELANIFNSMGNLYSLDGSCKKSLSCYESCLRIKLSGADSKSEQLLKIQRNIGLAYYKLGSFDQAMVVFEKILYTQKIANANGCVETATTLFHMGNVQLESGSFSEAIEFYNESIEIRRVKLGNDHPETLATISQIGTTLLRMGAYRKSIIVFADVLQLQKETLGENHEDIATTKFMIGVVHAKIKVFDVAMEYYEESLRQRRDILGRNHPKVGKTLSHMAAVRYAQKQYGATKMLCEDALGIFKHAHLSESHPYMKEVKHIILKVDTKSSRLPRKGVLEKSRR